MSSSPRWPSLLAGLCAGAFASPLWQDPVPPPPPVPAPAPAEATAEPVAEPATEPVPKPAKPPLGTPARGPTEGVYALRRRISDGLVDAAACSGYMAITNRHLFLCVAEDSPASGRVLFRAGVRSWRPEKDRVRTTILNGWLTDADGGIVVERAGHEELRKIVLVKGGVQVKQDERNWLEFERIE
jgi:hypothetical protein